eukprot:1159590-Pelagomonas_calceolata.AAC.1
MGVPHREYLCMSQRDCGRQCFSGPFRPPGSISAAVWPFPASMHAISIIIVSGTWTRTSARSYRTYRVCLLCTGVEFAPQVSICIHAPYVPVCTGGTEFACSVQVSKFAPQVSICIHAPHVPVCTGGTEFACSVQVSSLLHRCPSVSMLHMCPSEQVPKCLRVSLECCGGCRSNPATSHHVPMDLIPIVEQQPNVARSHHCELEIDEAYIKRLLYSLAVHLRVDIALPSMQLDFLAWGDPANG